MYAQTPACDAVVSEAFTWTIPALASSIITEDGSNEEMIQVENAVLIDAADYEVTLTNEITGTGIADPFTVVSTFTVKIV